MPPLPRVHTHIHFLILGTCDSVTLYGKKKSVDMGSWDENIILDYLGKPNFVIITVPIRRCKNVKSELKVKSM